MLALTGPRGQGPWRSRLSLSSWTDWPPWLSLLHIPTVPSEHLLCINHCARATGTKTEKQPEEKPLCCLQEANADMIM